MGGGGTGVSDGGGGTGVSDGGTSVSVGGTVSVGAGRETSLVGVGVCVGVQVGSPGSHGFGVGAGVFVR